MVRADLQAWVQSVPPSVWQRIQADGAKLRVAATFQDDVEIFSATFDFPSPLIVSFAETVTLIGTYVQLEGEMRVTQVDVRRPFDVHSTSSDYWFLGLVFSLVALSCGR